MFFTKFRPHSMRPELYCCIKLAQYAAFTFFEDELYMSGFEDLYSVNS